MQKLIHYQETAIYRGSVFRFPGDYPYENVVDFMLVNLAGKLSICVSSGYSCGFLLSYIPQEAYHKDAKAIDTKWLIENWNKWIYLDCKVEDVYILPSGYPVPSLVQKPNIPRYQQQKELLKYNHKAMAYGTVFRFPAREPYEQTVDFVILDNIYTLELVVLSGKHCGEIVYVFPKRAQFGRSIKSRWVKDHWREIYPHCSAKDVLVIRNNYIEQVI